MKISGMQALDYRAEAGRLTLLLAETTMEAVLAMDTAVCEIKTDAGDLVEALPGYTVKESITYEPATRVYKVTLGREGSDGVQRTLAALGGELTQVQQKMGADDVAIDDVMAALCELAGIVDALATVGAQTEKEV